jgi:hypothetical protein
MDHEEEDVDIVRRRGRTRIVVAVVAVVVVALDDMVMSDDPNARLLRTKNDLVSTSYIEVRTDAGLSRSGSKRTAPDAFLLRIHEIQY